MADARLTHLGLAPVPRAKRPQSVLFACTYNTVRSPMAEALARHVYGREVFIASAGVRAGESDPFVTTVMNEVGLDLHAFVPRSFDDLDDMSFDLIVTLSPEAHHTALEFTRSLPLDVVYWPTLDATGVQGSRETMLAAYRSVRESLAKRITELLEWRPA